MNIHLNAETLTGLRHSFRLRRASTFRAEVDALKRLQAETAAELDALLPAVLDKAFKGEL
jgi:hypothetical protein